MNASKTPLALRRPSATFVAAALAVLGLSACGSTTAARYDKAYPITVSVAPNVMEVPADELVTYDASRVEAFGRDFLKTGEGDITIAYPAAGKEAGPVVGEVTRRLRGVGVPNSKIMRGRYDPKVEDYTGVVVSFFGPSANAQDCPLNPGDPNVGISNESYLGFGCAYQQNVAAMLEDPRDATMPRPATPPIADRRFHVLSRYIAGEQTGGEPQEKTDTTEN